MTHPTSRSGKLDAALSDLLANAPELEAAAVVSFDGLPMATALPPAMDPDRVAAMSAALLSLGERAAEGLGRGALNQVYVEGEHGTVVLVSADDEAVLVAVAGRDAKVGMTLYEARRAAAAVAGALRADDVAPLAAVPPVAPVAVPSYEPPAEPVAHVAPVSAVQPAGYAPVASAGVPVDPEGGWSPSYLPNGTTVPPASWS